MAGEAAVVTRLPIVGLPALGRPADRVFDDTGTRLVHDRATPPVHEAVREGRSVLAGDPGLASASCGGGAAPSAALASGNTAPARVSLLGVWDVRSRLRWLRSSASTTGPAGPRADRDGAPPVGGPEPTPPDSDFSTSFYTSSRS